MSSSDVVEPAVVSEVHCEDLPVVDEPPVVGLGADADLVGLVAVEVADVFAVGVVDVGGGERGSSAGSRSAGHR